MLWFGRRPEPGADETVAPATLTPPLDPERFRDRFATLQEALSEISGVEPVLQALETKSLLFREALAQERLEVLDREAVELLLDTVMPARRRIGAALACVGPEVLRRSVRVLLEGPAPLAERLDAFARTLAVSAMSSEPREARRLRRGALDFAAELLHFHDPVRYPLMTRWVWDAETQSGALRELVRDSDSVKQIPWGDSPGVYEAGRIWIAQQMKEHGVYRAPHFLVDLYLAHVYGGYMLSMSAGMGLLKADFGGSGDPLEIAKKLLGIDESRLKGSRVKRAASS